jgi:hypothetical protein
LTFIKKYDILYIEEREEKPTKPKGICIMELGRYEKVRMPDGKLYGNLQARWFRKHNAFGVCTDKVDECGNPVWMYSNEVVTVEPKKSKFVPTKENCTVLVDVCDVTDKAYAYYTGFVSTKGKYHKEWIAKSICYVDENGKVFKPMWA